MVIFVNLRAAGGSANKKWRRFTQTPPLSLSANPPHVCMMNESTSIERTILEALEQGERDFVAAGGDGTVNLLLNMLLRLAPPKTIPSLRLGAIGIGSSNDFHKPFSASDRRTGFPARLDFSSATARDVGCMTFDEGDRSVSRYFLINASVGITAEANHTFNHPGRILQLLKKSWPSGAIVYAALHTIIHFRNIDVTVSIPGNEELATTLTNIGIVKSPHFSGNFHYHTPFRPASGRFDVHLCHSMSTIELLRLLRSLAKGKFETTEKSRSWETASLTISSKEEFAVEFDGEIVRTKSVRFTIFPNYLKVCSC